MKNFWLIFVSILTITSLTSYQGKGALNGKWTLICFRDYSNDSSSCRPANYVPGQLTFTFEDDGHTGSIKGRTVVNKTFGNYVMEGNQIKVLNFGGTKLNESGWGSDFGIQYGIQVRTYLDRTV